MRRVRRTHLLGDLSGLIHCAREGSLSNLSPFLLAEKGGLWSVGDAISRRSLARFGRSYTTSRDVTRCGERSPPRHRFTR